MPIIVNIPDPYSDGILEGCWSYCAQLNLDLNNKVAGVRYDTFKDKASAYAGKPPIAQTYWNVLKDEQAAVYGQAELISPYVPPVYGDPDPVTGEIPVLQPEQAPVYSNPPLLSQAIPSFDEGLVANATAFAQLMTYFDNMALSRPEFAGGAIEQG